MLVEVVTVVEIYILAAALPLHLQCPINELLLIGKNIWLYALLSTTTPFPLAPAEVYNLLRTLLGVNIILPNL